MTLHTAKVTRDKKKRFLLFWGDTCLIFRWIRKRALHTQNTVWHKQIMPLRGTSPSSCMFDSVTACGAFASEEVFTDRLNVAALAPRRLACPPSFFAWYHQSSSCCSSFFSLFLASCRFGWMSRIFRGVWGARLISFGITSDQVHMSDEGRTKIFLLLRLDGRWKILHHIITLQKHQKIVGDFRNCSKFF